MCFNKLGVIYFTHYFQKKITVVFFGKLFHRKNRRVFPRGKNFHRGFDQRHLYGWRLHCRRGAADLGVPVGNY